MAPKVSITTLGCAKNIVETDFIKSSLIEKGYSIVSDPGQAEVIIVNTCGFIEPAKQEAIDTILEVSRYKECGRCQALIVVGCLAQRYPKELGRELPEIDAIVGLSAHLRLPEIIETTLKGEKIAVHDLPPEVYIEMRRRTASNGPSAYLQIADGCNNRCSYCAIPLIRGKYHSRAMESLLEETRFLLKHGVRETNLIAQDITRYGIDLCGRSMLVSLVQELSRMDRLEWIRLFYMQPKNFSDELLAETAQNPKICPYLDLPFQHASERILKRMNRGGRKEDYLKLIERLRNRIPDLAIRTTVIVGFPERTREISENLPPSSRRQVSITSASSSIPRKRKRTHINWEIAFPRGSQRKDTTSWLLSSTPSPCPKIGLWWAKK
ncbi:MAG: MiaB/RimO family radical SAM methylthiotransferase [Actinomycetota bacterium]|nr:MiaB/RimO family radical SAM methylthiotransferase [Actinomycetota bacterium]